MSHVTTTLGWIKHNIWHCKTLHITPNSTSRHVIWWYWNMWYGIMCRKWGLMWNIVELWWWDVECVTRCHCISHLHHSTTYYIASCSTSNADHLWQWFHITPSFLTISHISYYTSISHSTIFHFAMPYLKNLTWYRPHYPSCHISCCIPFYIVFHIPFHVLHTTFQHTHYLIPHRTFHIPWHSTHTNP